MWILKLLIAFPLLAFFIVFLVQNNEIVPLWPLTNMEWFPVERVGTSIVYFVLFCLGYFFGRLSAWSAYAPVRALLRQQKKENKALSKEHAKLNHEHEVLNQQITSLQEAEKQAKANAPTFGQRIKGWFSSKQDNDE
jgi:cell division protein FtsB